MKALVLLLAFCGLCLDRVYALDTEVIRSALNEFVVTHRTEIEPRAPTLYSPTLYQVAKDDVLQTSDSDYRFGRWIVIGGDGTAFAFYEFHAMREYSGGGGHSIWEAVRIVFERIGKTMRITKWSVDPDGKKWIEEKDQPNQALLPTSTAVTPPASHESRQP